MASEDRPGGRARGKPRAGDAGDAGDPALAHAATVATDGPADSRRIALLAAAAAGIDDPIQTSLADTVGPSARAAGGAGGAPPDLVATRPGVTPPGAAADDLARGSLIDRFVVLDRLGFGGMGVVVSAYDPELDRRVAIKVLRDDLFRAELPTVGRQRLQREARAMARLSHPNVVAVYEIGRLGDRVYVVMEYVDGLTVTRWLERERRSWREIVGVFTHAGRGLAAAHEAGLVHRDFKPDNVLVGKGGQVRVTDFGLVSATGQAIETTTLADAALPDEALSRSLTCTGAILGTPVYMAPEQHAGEPADPRTDQFSFCVALYEALYRQRPFAGATYDQIAARVKAGALRPPPVDAGVPPWLGQVVVRGLATNPADRFPSMAELLSALDRDPIARRRRRLGLAAAAAGVALLVGLAAYGLARRPAAGPVCGGAERELAGVWDAAAAAQVARAFRATGLPYAESSLAGATRLLDDYAAGWVAMRTEACQATHRRGTQSAEMLDRRTICLDDRRAALHAVTRLFARADRQVVEEAVETAGGLPGLASCADLEALRQLVPLPEDPAVRARVAALRRQVAEAAALDRAGKYEEGLAIARAAAAAADGIGYRPVEAEVLRNLATLTADAGDVRRSSELLTDALVAALAGRHDEAAIRTATQLVWATGYRLGDTAEGERWGRIAAALLERGSADRELEAELYSNLAVLAVVAGDYPEALARAERSVALRRELVGDDHPRTASAYVNLGVARKNLGQLEPALAAYQHALAVYRAALGDHHPNTAMALHNLAVVEKRMGKLEQAEVDLVAAIERWRRVLPADHQNLGMALFNLGVVRVDLGKLDDGESDLERALDIKRAKLGPDHPSVAAVEQALAAVARARGDDRRALAILAPLPRRLAAKLGDDHPSVASALRDLGLLQLDLGDLAAAADALSRAVAIRAAKLPADHRDLAQSRVDLGRLELARGRAEDAVAPLRLAVQHLAPGAAPGGAAPGAAPGGAAPGAAPGGAAPAADPAAIAAAADLAEARFLLARALWDADQDRAEALALARRAAAALAALADDRRAGAAEVDAWLAARGRGPR